MIARPITEDDLNGFIDDRLDAGRRAEVSAYLDSHPEVAARVAARRDERDLLRAAFAGIAEAPLPPELDLDRMVEARRRAPVPSRGVMAAAALVLLCLGGAGGWVLRGLGAQPVEGLQAVGREAVASYAVFAPDRARPVEIRAEDRAQLIAWTSRRLGRPVAFPDLAVAGYHLIGGRVVPTEHGPAALFMYTNEQGDRLAVFARPIGADADTAMAPLARDGINGFSWSSDGLGYSLVGTPPRETLHPLADEARRQVRKAA